MGYIPAFKVCVENIFEFFNNIGIVWMSINDNDRMSTSVAERFKINVVSKPQEELVKAFLKIKDNTISAPYQIKIQRNVDIENYADGKETIGLFHLFIGDIIDEEKYEFLARYNSHIFLHGGHFYNNMVVVSAFADRTLFSLNVSKMNEAISSMTALFSPYMNFIYVQRPTLSDIPIVKELDRVLGETFVYSLIGCPPKNERKAQTTLIACDIIDKCQIHHGEPKLNNFDKFSDVFHEYLDNYESQHIIHEIEQYQVLRDVITSNSKV